MSSPSREPRLAAHATRIHYSACTTPASRSGSTTSTARCCTNGELARRIREDALTGMTSNPDDLREGARRGHGVRRAARAAPPELHRLGAVRAGRDERRARRVRPLRAVCTSDRRATTATSRSRSRPARRTTPTRRSPKRSASGRPSTGPNVMVKVPGTDEGARRRAPAHRGRDQRQHHAALRDRGARPRDRGVPRRARGPRRGRPADRPHRVGRELLREPRRHRDRQAARRDGRRRNGAGARSPAGAARARPRSRTRKLAYRSSRSGSPAPRWEALAAKGARVQRPLWASTSTKNPGVPRRDLRRGADRPAHGEHDAAGDASMRSATTATSRARSTRTSTTRKLTIADARGGRHLDRTM